MNPALILANYISEKIKPVLSQIFRHYHAFEKRARRNMRRRLGLFRRNVINHRPNRMASIHDVVIFEWRQRKYLLWPKNFIIRRLRSEILRTLPNLCFGRVWNASNVWLRQLARHCRSHAGKGHISATYFCGCRYINQKSYFRKHVEITVGTCCRIPFSKFDSAEIHPLPFFLIVPYIVF